MTTKHIDVAVPETDMEFNLLIYILCKINLAIVLYGSVHPHLILHFIF